MINRKTFNELVSEDYILLPGVYDCLSAKMAEKVGFKAVFFSGGAYSMANMGLPDIGFYNPSELINQLVKIRNFIDIPIICDIDNGFGNSIHASYICRTLESIGVNGVQIDDQILPQNLPTLGKEKMDINLLLPKLISIRNEVSKNFTIIFRTISNITSGLDEAIYRINSVSNLIDYAYVDGLKSIDEIEKVAKNSKVKLLINMNEKSIASNLEINYLKKLGYKIGLYPVSAFSIAANSIKNVYETIINEGNTLKIRSNMYDILDLYSEMKLNEKVMRNIKYYEVNKNEE